MTWLVKAILDWILQTVSVIAAKTWQKDQHDKARKKMQDEAWAKYEAVLNEPGATDEQIARAYETYLRESRGAIH